MALIQKSFSDLITFTRASGGGRFNELGVYEWLPANQPRFDFDPVTGEAKGLLIEEQRTNLLTYSRDFANGVWAKTNVSITANTAISPDGTVTASTLAPSAGTGVTGRVQRTFSSTTGQMYTFSIYAKQKEVRYVRVLSTGATSSTVDAYFDLQTASSGYANGVTTSVTKVAFGYVLCSISIPATVTGTGTVYVQTVAAMGSPVITTDGTSGIYIWGAQLEAGSFPTSYIPTTTAQVTRAADVASVNVLSPWFNASEGTLFVEASTFGNRPAWVYAQVWDGTTSNRIGIARVQGTGVTAVVDTGGASQVATVGSDSAQIRAALAYRANDVSISRNGAVPEVDASVALPANLTQLAIGRSSGAGTFLNGHIRSIRYYPRAYYGDDLQYLSTHGYLPWEIAA